ncbi:hypothetical protein B0H13DRAFT_2362462 [Mycena leptocephala]|nr:hypothetical protein B0H13DRAFT_2362462 [Mycena leptocephala]
MKRCNEEREPQPGSDLEGVAADREEGQEEKDGREDQGAPADPALGVYTPWQGGRAVGDVRAGGWTGGRDLGETSAASAAAPWVGAWLTLWRGAISSFRREEEDAEESEGERAGEGRRAAMMRATLSASSSRPWVLMGSE